MAYASISKPSLHFNTKLYTGTGSSNAITGVGFQPDWTWIKNRDGTDDNKAFDSLRGVTKVLKPNTDGAETTDSNTLTAFGTDGFTVGSDGGVNGNGDNFVSWNWKAGTTSIPSGSTTDPSAVSINTTAGFGIYKITAPASGNYVLKHGLGATPKMVIVKRTNGQQKWMVWHHTFSNATDDYLQLNDAAAKATYSTCWGTMNSTDCTIATGGTLDVGGEHVIYVFTEVSGYNRFGSYIGNGNANGRFIYTGFKPAWVMVKNIDNNSRFWTIIDNKRNVFNPIDNWLYANENQAEYDASSFPVDFLSNGFKNRSTGSYFNTNAENYVYMAFAEEPLVANVGQGVPATAR